jgi:hypothetical protein
VGDAAAAKDVAALLLEQDYGGLVMGLKWDDFSEQEQRDLSSVFSQLTGFARELRRQQTERRIDTRTMGEACHEAAP